MKRDTLCVAAILGLLPVTSHGQTGLSSIVLMPRAVAPSAPGNGTEADATDDPNDREAEAPEDLDFGWFFRSTGHLHLTTRSEPFQRRRPHELANWLNYQIMLRARGFNHVVFEFHPAFTEAEIGVLQRNEGLLNVVDRVRLDLANSSGVMSQEVLKRLLSLTGRMRNLGRLTLAGNLNHRIEGSRLDMELVGPEQPALQILELQHVDFASQEELVEHLRRLADSSSVMDVYGFDWTIEGAAIDEGALNSVVQQLNMVAGREARLSLGGDAPVITFDRALAL